MTLYLAVTIGKSRYLIASADVVEVQPASAENFAAIDCRQLFGAPAETPGYRLRVACTGEAARDLVVDRLDGLVELGGDAFRPLPPIGALGAMIDAVAVPAGDAAPALRLRLDAAP
jgi:hypothetical protein